MEAKSSIIAIGLTVHNTPVEIREKLSVPEVRCAGTVECFCLYNLLQYLEITLLASWACTRVAAARRISVDDYCAISAHQAEWPRAIEELVSFPHIEEAAVLSTCNRMELYVVALSWHRVRTWAYDVLLWTPGGAYLCERSRSSCVLVCCCGAGRCSPQRVSACQAVRWVRNVGLRDPLVRMPGLRWVQKVLETHKTGQCAGCLHARQCAGCGRWGLETYLSVCQACAGCGRWGLETYKTG